MEAGEADAQISAGGPVMPTRVLVVEDDADIRGVIADVLVAEGYEVEQAGDGEQGLEKLGSFGPDVVLLDMNMPVMDGHQFIAAGKMRGVLACPVIIVTAYSRRALVVEPFAAEVIEKPFEFADLVRAIDRYVTQEQIKEREERKKPE